MNKSLRQLASVHYGKSPNVFRTDEEMFPIIGTGGVYGYTTVPLFEVPLTVVARKGTLGKPTFSEKPSWVTDTAYAVIATDDTDPKWLYYCLDNFDLESLNEATGVPSINRDYLYRVCFFCPDQRQQHKIARILTTVDNLIEKTEALIAKYQSIKQGMMYDLFTRGVDENGHLRPTQSEAPHLYRESELGWIPKEWHMETGQSLCHPITKGTTPKVLHEVEGVNRVPFLRVQNLSFNGDLIFDNDQSFVDESVHRGELRRSCVYPHDVLMNLVGPPLGKITLVPNLYPEWNLNQAIAIFRVLGKCSPDFLCFYLQTHMAKCWLLTRSHRTSGQRNLTLDMCRELPFPLPNDNSEHDAICTILLAAQKRVYAEVTYLKELQEIKAALMQDLLTGKVRVKVDEPEEATVNV